MMKTEDWLEIQRWFSVQKIEIREGISVYGFSAREKGNIRDDERYLSGYDRRFSPDERKALRDLGIPPWIANEYPPELTPSDIWYIKEHIYTSGWQPNLNPSDVVRYPHQLGISKIVGLIELGIPPTADLDFQMRVARSLEIIRELYDPFEGEGTHLVGVGAEAVLLETQGLLYKISPSIEQETDLLRRIASRVELSEGPFEGPKHVVQVLDDDSVEEGYVQLEYIHGRTLADILDKEKKKFNPKDALQYGEHILGGLFEMKEAGIYHKDLWLGNVMIDEHNDRAVIIDLGCATDNLKHDGIEGVSRRYGGRNDLDSLGQIMYRMVAGRHIHNPTVDQSTYNIPDVIKAEREKAHNDPAVQRQRLRQVDDAIGKDDKHLATVIRACLTAQGEDLDYQRASDLFPF